MTLRVVPSLLTLNKDGSWPMWVDSCTSNHITIKYNFLISRLDDLLDGLHGISIFSKINLPSRYQVHTQQSHKNKTNFKTRDDFYEWLVMPFGLLNAPFMFVRLMNHVLRPLLGVYDGVYFYGILIYSKFEAKHQHQVCEIL